MKNNLKKFGYGILIGISNTIPGFSGGTMILILGIFEEFTSAIASLTKTPLKAIKELWSIALGMLIGIVASVVTIAICLEKWPIITASFFVGLVVITIPFTYKKIKNQKLKIGSVVSFILCLAFVIFLSFADKIGLSINLDNPNIFIALFVMLVAAIASAAMIIPAASGMLILLAFGLYDSIIGMCKNCLIYLKDGNFAAIWQSCIILIPFAIGVVLGVILVSKVITYLFKNHPQMVWSGILGLLFASMFAIYYSTYNDYLKSDITIFTDHLVINIILSVVAFLFGFFILRWMMKLYERKEQQSILEEQEKIA